MDLNRADKAIFRALQTVVIVLAVGRVLLGILKIVFPLIVLVLGALWLFFGDAQAQPVTLTANTENGAITRAGAGSVAVALVADRMPLGCVQAASVVHEHAISLQGLHMMALWVGPAQVIPDGCGGRRRLAGIVYNDGAGEICPDHVEAPIALDGGLEVLIGKPAPTNIWLALGSDPTSDYPPQAVWQGFVNVVMGPCNDQDPAILVDDFEEANP